MLINSKIHHPNFSEGLCLTLISEVMRCVRDMLTNPKIHHLNFSEGLCLTLISEVMSVLTLTIENTLYESLVRNIKGIT